MAFRKLVGSYKDYNLSTHILEDGYLAVDVDTGSLRLGDGTTSGGTVINTGGGGGSSSSLGDLSAIGSTLTAPSNADFNITTAGTGNIVLNDLSISDNTLSTNRSNDDLHINASGTGTVVLENLKIGSSGSTVTTILDEDNMSSNSATSLATQQSIKAYVDSNALSLIDEDNFSTDSATRPPSQQSVKAYVDSNAGGTLAGLSDTGITSANAGQVLLHDGTDSFDNKDINLFGTTLNFTAGLSLFMGAHIFTISGADGSNYTFQYYEDSADTTADPALVLIEDHTYVFNLAYGSSSHPFQIQTTDGTALTNSTGAR